MSAWFKAFMALYLVGVIALLVTGHRSGVAYRAEEARHATICAQRGGVWDGLASRCLRSADTLSVAP